MALLEEASFNAVRDNLPAILGWVEEKSTEYLPFSLAMRLQLAAEEAIVNVVNYAYDENSLQRPIRLRMGKDDNFYLEIADKGLPFNPLENIQGDPNAPLEEREPGGWGRELITQMTSAASYAYTDNANVLRLEENPADAADLPE